MWSSLGNVTFTGPWVVAPCTKLHVVTTQKNIILNIQAIRLMSVTNCEYRFFRYTNEGRTEGVVEITPPAPIRLQWNLEPPCFAAIELSYQVRRRIWTVNEANFLDLELRHYFLLKHSVGKIKQCHWCMGDRFWQGKTKVLVKNRPPLPVCLPKILHELAWDWTLAFRLRSQWQTTRANFEVVTTGLPWCDAVRRRPYIMIAAL